MAFPEERGAVHAAVSPAPQAAPGLPAGIGVSAHSGRHMPRCALVPFTAGSCPSVGFHLFPAELWERCGLSSDPGRPGPVARLPARLPRAAGVAR